MYSIDEWKQSDLNSVPSEPIWGCNIMSLTSLKGFLSVQATKKMKTQETFKKNSGRMSVKCVTKDFFLFTLSTTVKYVLLWWMKKVLPEFCPFSTYLRVQNNVSDIFERFSVTLCNKKMKTQETFTKSSGYMNVWSVTNDFLIITF